MSPRGTPESSASRTHPPLTRTPLSRDRILRTGLVLADEHGLEWLSMRKLGQALDVEAMSLYHHVSNKEDLVDGMIDLVFAEIEFPVDGDWQTAMRARAVCVRAVLGRHRWANGLMESRSSPGPANLRHHDSVIGCLRRAGFSVPLVAHAYSLLDSYTYGFAMSDRALPFESPEQIAELAQAILSRFPVDEFPHLAELTFDHVLTPGYDYGIEFAFGLDLVINGLQHALARAG